MRTDGFQRLIRHPRRVRAHVGNQTHRALIAQLDTLIQPLRYAHRPRRLEIKLARCLLQEASRKLYFQPSRTMRIAQRLYEGIELGDQGAVGLITYMRTDSPRVSDQALAGVRSHIESKYGKKYLPEKPIQYRSSKSAQDAHEAIR